MKLESSFLPSLVLCLCLPIIALAQSKDKINEEYFRLKTKHTEFKGRGIVKPDLIFLSETQKFSDGTAKVRFVIDGKLSRNEIHIQPSLITRDSSGKVVSVTNAGESMTVRAGLLKNPAGKETIANPEVILPIESIANALEITLAIENEGESNRKLIVSLTEDQDVVGLRVFPPNAVNASDDGGCDCPFVELTNSRCGTIGKFCGGFVGNVLDGINCSITCGSECANKNCTVPVGGEEN